MYLICVLQIIANHHMQSISFASGGDPVSMNSLKFYFLIRVKRNFYVKHVNHYLSFPNILLQFVNSHM